VRPRLSGPPGGEDPQSRRSAARAPAAAAAAAAFGPRLHSYRHRPLRQHLELDWIKHGAGRPGRHWVSRRDRPICGSSPRRLRCHRAVSAHAAAGGGGLCLPHRPLARA